MSDSEGSSAPRPVPLPPIAGAAGAGAGAPPMLPPSDETDELGPLMNTDPFSPPRAGGGGGGSRGGGARSGGGSRGGPANGGPAPHPPGSPGGSSTVFPPTPVPMTPADSAINGDDDAAAAGGADGGAAEVRYVWGTDVTLEEVKAQFEDFAATFTLPGSDEPLYPSVLAHVHDTSAGAVEVDLRHLASHAADAYTKLVRYPSDLMLAFETAFVDLYRRRGGCPRGRPLYRPRLWPPPRARGVGAGAQP